MLALLRRHGSLVAVVVSLLSLVLSTTGWASAATRALFGANTKPHPHSLLLLGRNAKFPASAIPTVANSNRVGGLTSSALSARIEQTDTRQAESLLGQTTVTLSCPSGTKDLGSFCLASSLFSVPSGDTGRTDYFFASKACRASGGYLPSASELLEGADIVPLASTLTDDPNTAHVDIVPGDGLKDLREMSSTLITTTAGSSAAGSEGVSANATGNPAAGEPNPTPQPADPDPDTLQYVTVYDNGTNGGFAGSEPVSVAENFRCAYNKVAATVTAPLSFSKKHSPAKR